eukprot:1945908-Amphidinium_carterae.3
MGQGDTATTRTSDDVALHGYVANTAERMWMPLPRLCQSFLVPNSWLWSKFCRSAQRFDLGLACHTARPQTPEKALLGT